MSAAPTPIDPAPESIAGPSQHRPVHLRWSSLALVAVGGALGTAARDLLSLAAPAGGGIAWVIFWINVSGAVALGFLIESLARRGPDVGARRTARLVLGTGFLGGFTTYSTLAVGTAALLADGRWGAGVGSALLTVVVGAVGVVVGLAVATLVAGRGRGGAAR